MKKKLVIVDDDALLISAVKRVLESTGRYEVLVEGDSARAMETILAAKPDLVILDVIMPHVDGGTLAALLLDHPKTRNTPILFLTSTVSEHKVKDHDGLIAGRPFVAKTSDMKTLLKRVEECLAPGSPS